MPDSEHQMFIAALLRLLEEHTKNAFDLSFSLCGNRLSTDSCWSLLSESITEITDDLCF